MDINERLSTNERIYESQRELERLRGAVENWCVTEEHSFGIYHMLVENYERFQQPFEQQVQNDGGESLSIDDFLILLLVQVGFYTASMWLAEDFLTKEGKINEN